MKKQFVVVLVLAIVLMAFAGCSSNSQISYTFSVDTGDTVKITLDTSDDYDLSSDLPFAISCNGSILSEGTFILGEAYSQYVAAVEDDDSAELLDSGERDGIEYIFWSYDDTEFNYVILIADSSTGILLGNAVSRESAEACFDRLTISLEN